MEHLSKQLLVLSEKIKSLLISYSEIVKENEALKGKIFLLENDLAALKGSLEEKRDMLNTKDEDSIFVTMLIDELLEEFSRFNCTFNNFVFSQENNGRDNDAASFLGKNKSSDELGL